MLNYDDSRLVAYALRALAANFDLDDLANLGLDGIDPYETDMESDAECDAVLDARLDHTTNRLNELAARIEKRGIHA